MYNHANPSKEDLDVSRFKRDERSDEKVSKLLYDSEIKRLHHELVVMQRWVEQTGEKVVIIFEGRDAAGKGGVIKRIVEPLNPRTCRVIALSKPSDRERSQWYFQRYIRHLPSAGEIIILDRSWYNRAGVERVMGFCSDDEYKEFMESCPMFERLIVRSGIKLLKYWLSVTEEEQEKRFLARARDPLKMWKLSDIDMRSRDCWQSYSNAKEVMFTNTNIEEAPWHVVDSNNKKKARLNCMTHILNSIYYEDIGSEEIPLAARKFTEVPKTSSPKMAFIEDHYHEQI